MTRSTFEDAGAQLDAALSDLGRALREAFAPIIELALYAGQQLLDAGHRAGEIARRLLPQRDAGPMPDAEQLLAGSTDPLDWLPARSRFDVAMRVISDAGPDLLPWQRELLVAAARGDLVAPAAVCSCPSGDGSLRWPCPVHPPAGGHSGRHTWREDMS